jgi:hypothetical protein
VRVGDRELITMRHRFVLIGGALAFVVGVAACTSFGADDPIPVVEGGAPDAPSEAAVVDASADAVDDHVGPALPACIPVDAGCGTSCDDRCPAVGLLLGDTLRVEAQGNMQDLRSLVDCHRYHCAVLFDQDGDGGFDCRMPGLGYVGRACSFGFGKGTGTDCRVGTVIRIGVDAENDCNANVCTYECERITD